MIAFVASTSALGFGLLGGGYGNNYGGYGGYGGYPGNKSWETVYRVVKKSIFKDERYLRFNTVQCWVAKFGHFGQ